MRLLTTCTIAAIVGFGAVVSMPTGGLAQSEFGIGISVGFAPPPMPIYDQPPIPGYGYIWTPGYWAWNPEVGDYYWVPGTWVLPPGIGLLWTPAWWGWGDGFYAFHSGYWGPHIGYYGGINYGFGYTGYGYQGGYWRGREFFYNRAVNNVRNVRITNKFERPVMEPPRRNRVSYSGGVGGVMARPTSEQIAVMRERRLAPTQDQMRHFQMAGSDRSMMAKVNHGAPMVTATQRPAEFMAVHPTGDYRLEGPHAYRPPAPSAYHPPPTPAFQPPSYPRGYPAQRQVSPGYNSGSPIYHPPMGGSGGLAPPPPHAPPNPPQRPPTSVQHVAPKDPGQPR